jgi:hypothetical protein
MRLRSAAAATLLMFAGWTLPTRAYGDEPVRPKEFHPEAHPESSTRWTVVGVGLGVSVFWYGAAAGMATLFPDAPGAKELYIPVAGPWMSLAETGCRDDEPDCSTFEVVLRAILTGIDGVGQAGGLLVAIEGAFLPTENSATLESDARRETSPRVVVTPGQLSATSDAWGVKVSGSF